MSERRFKVTEEQAKKLMLYWNAKKQLDKRLTDTTFHTKYNAFMLMMENRMDLEKQRRRDEDKVRVEIMGETWETDHGEIESMQILSQENQLVVYYKEEDVEE